MVQCSGSKWAWAKPKTYVSESKLEASLNFSKFGVNGSSLCVILWSRRPEHPCVLSCLINYLFTIELDIGGLDRVVTQDRLGIVQLSISQMFLTCIVKWSKICKRNYWIYSKVFQVLKPHLYSSQLHFITLLSTHIGQELQHKPLLSTITLIQTFNALTLYNLLSISLCLSGGFLFFLLCCLLDCLLALILLSCLWGYNIIFWVSFQNI